MTDKAKFLRLIRILCILFLVSFFYIISADRFAPLTTEGRVHGHVIQVAPEVSGLVTSVEIENNIDVKEGDTLFTIDSRQYEIALEQAELNLELAKERQMALYAQKRAAEASVKRALSSYKNALSDYKRIDELAKKQVVSQSVLDESVKNYEYVSSSLEIEKQNLLAINAQIGNKHGAITEVRIAKSVVENAKLNFENTIVRAPSDGVVTNLRLNVGTLVNAHAPLISLIPNSSMWLAADFREKSVAMVDSKYKAIVAFDAYPGEVYHYNVATRDKGVASAHQYPDGMLTDIQVNNRWIRDAQRTRINLEDDTPLPESLFVGSRVSMVLYSGESKFWQLIANIRIRLVSVLHYIY